jgi:NNP family nitrate/nitrite transporter-like MFS transporter
MASPLTQASDRVRGIWSLSGKYGVLHATWFAFFLTFMVWFGFAPFAKTIGADLGLTPAQLGTLALCNVALTVPARVLVGMALDRLGPRRMYAGLLVFAAVPSILTAIADDFTSLVIARLLCGLVGAGFVVGIRMVAEWFPPRELGMAEGVYGGWGNFGSAAAAFALPIVAGWLGGDDGWRWAIGTLGLVAAAYGVLYLRLVADTPDGRSYVRSRKVGALEVTSRKAVFVLAGLCVPLAGVLALIAWRVWKVGVLDTTGLWVCIGVAVALLAYQLRQVVVVNRAALADEYPAEDQYPIRSVVILCVAYFCTFGSELAVVSMLPTFFADTWGLGPSLAGATASAFAFMNLAARPAGGLLSDLLGSRRRTLGLLMAGLVAGYAGMALLGSAWPVPVAMGVAMFCSFFVQSGEGAVYAIVPLVKKRVSGQISGLVGAYGNVGAVVFLTSLLYVSPSTFFLLIAGASVVGTVLVRWLPEPAESFAADLTEEPVEVGAVPAGLPVRLAPAGG